MLFPACRALEPPKTAILNSVINNPTHIQTISVAVLSTLLLTLCLFRAFFLQSSYLSMLFSKKSRSRSAHCGVSGQAVQLASVS